MWFTDQMSKYQLSNYYFVKIYLSNYQMSIYQMSSPKNCQKYLNMFYYPTKIINNLKFSLFPLPWSCNNIALWNEYTILWVRNKTWCLCSIPLELDVAVGVDTLSNGSERICRCLWTMSTNAKSHRNVLKADEVIWWKIRKTIKIFWGFVGQSKPIYLKITRKSRSVLPKKIYIYIGKVWNII